jgi:hypothetical protein
VRTPYDPSDKFWLYVSDYDISERPDLASRLTVNGYKGRVERFVLVTVEAFDWNCPQHVTPRFTLTEIEAMAAPLYARIAELEGQLAKANLIRAEASGPIAAKTI